MFDSECNGVLKYKWVHRDGWKYEHEGTTDITNGTYWVDCMYFLSLFGFGYRLTCCKGHTKNYLEIPTTFKNGALEIKLTGDVKLGLGVKGATQSWRYARLSLVPVI